MYGIKGHAKIQQYKRSDPTLIRCLQYIVYYMRRSCGTTETSAKAKLMGRWIDDYGRFPRIWIYTMFNTEIKYVQNIFWKTWDTLF
ncbi:hypothetical protein Trydic_g4375 [Trypoxylus dichotomus]